MTGVKLEAIEGVWVKLLTTLDKTFEGYIYAYDSAVGVVVLQVPNKSNFDFHMLKLSAIKQVIPSTEIPRNESILVPITNIPIEKLMAKEKQAIREEQERIARLGVGVTEDAQNVFDALSKTLPVRWDKKDIIVMNEIVISEPYKECKPLKELNKTLLDRVSKVLEGERAKLGLE